MAASQIFLAISSGDLVDRVSSSGSTTIYPSDDAILAILQACFRADLPYTRIGCTNLLVINPYKALANVNDVSAKEYEELSGDLQLGRIYTDLATVYSLPPLRLYSSRSY